MAQKEAYQKKIKYLEERNRELEEQLREKKAHETEADQSFPLGSDEKGGTSLYKKVNDLRAKNSALKWKIESLEKGSLTKKEIL